VETGECQSTAVSLQSQ